MNFNYNVFNQVERPELFLANMNQDYVGCLKNNTDLVLDLYFNNISTLSFNYYKKLDGIDNPFYDNIENLMTVLLVGVGWFQITSCNSESDGATWYKKIECKSLENEFCTARITSFGQLGNYEDWDGGLDLYKLYDIGNPDKSILHIVLSELPVWSIGTIDPNINNIAKSFSVDEIDAYSFLTGDVAESYDCIFLFNTFNKTISAHTLDSLGNDTGIVLSYRNLIDNVSFKSNSSDIKTRMAVYGGDNKGLGNLNIIECNATGTSFIENYDYYLDRMSVGLKNAYNNYRNDLEYNSTLISGVLNTLGVLYDEYYSLQYKMPVVPSENWSEYGLTHLIEFQDNQNTIMSVSFNKTSDYNSARNKRNAITAEIAVRVGQVDSKTSQINTQIALRNSYIVNIKDYLTNAQFLELSRIRRTVTFTDNSFISTNNMTDKETLDMTIGLMNLAKKKLDRISKPQYEMEVNVANYTAIPEFKKFTGLLDVGSILVVDYDEHSTGKNYVKSRVLNIHINFDNPNDFSMTFSNKNSLDGFFALQDLQEQAKSTATSMSIGSTSWNTVKNNSNEVTMFITNALDASRNKIISSENQSVTFGEYGLQIKQYNSATGGFDPKQIWMANGMIAFSNDSFQTVRMALGEIELNGQNVYGLVADAIVGRLIIGNYLQMQNDSATMTFNNNGLTVTNGVNTVKIDPTNSNVFQILRGSTQVLYFDSSGNGHFSGRLDGASGTFSGNLSAAGGTFSGNLSAVGGTFTGTLQGVDGTFTGTLTGNTINGAVINSSEFNSVSGGNTLYVGGAYLESRTSGGVCRILGAYMQVTDSSQGTTNIYGGSIQVGSTSINTNRIVVTTLVSDNATVSGNSVLTTLTGASISHNHNINNLTGTLYTSNIGLSAGGISGQIAIGSGNAVGWNYAENTYQKASDLRLKYDIKDVGDVTDFYMDLIPKSFKFKAGLYKDIENHGFIAQQIKSNLLKHNIESGMVYNSPNVYDQGEYCDGGEHLNLKYDDLHLFHVKMIQKHENTINELNLRIKSLEEKINKE